MTIRYQKSTNTFSRYFIQYCPRGLIVLRRVTTFEAVVISFIFPLINGGKSAPITAFIALVASL